MPHLRNKAKDLLTSPVEPTHHLRLIFHDDFGRIIRASDLKSNETRYVVHQWTRADQSAFSVVGTFASREEADEFLLSIDEEPQGEKAA